MRKTLMVLVSAAMVACRDGTAPKPALDVTGQWGFAGAVSGHSRCGFYAMATLAGSSSDYTGTAQLEMTLPKSPISVDVTGKQRSVMLGPIALAVERQEPRRVMGSYQCEGASGVWSAVRYP